MSGTAPLKHTQTDDRLQSYHREAPLHPDTLVVANPVHEMFAKWTLSPNSEATGAGYSVAAFARDAESWSVPKAAFVLIAGCGLFWLLIFAALSIIG